MKLNELSPQQLAQLYRQELTSAFPPEELKPLRSMLSLMEQGRYQALGLYDGEDLVAYALIWLEPGCPFALLDYLGTMAGLRDRGLGSRMLDLLAEHYAHFRGIFGRRRPLKTGTPPGSPCAAGGWPSISATASATAGTTAPCSASTTGP